MASNAENVSIWWRRHGQRICSALDIISQPTETIAPYQDILDIFYLHSLQK